MAAMRHPVGFALMTMVVPACVLRGVLVVERAE